MGKVVKNGQRLIEKGVVKFPFPFRTLPELTIPELMSIKFFQNAHFGVAVCTSNPDFSILSTDRPTAQVAIDKHHNN